MVFPGRFDGKILVVTGAAQGLGEAVATRAAREGGAVALVDRSELVYEVAEKLASEGAQTVAFTADLEQYMGAATAMAAARNHFGRIDILINNVGGAINFKPYVEFTEDQIVAEIRRSLFPTMWCCRAVLPIMVRAPEGHDRQRLVGGRAWHPPHPVLGGQGWGQRAHRVPRLGVRRARNPGRGHRARRHRGTAAKGLRAAPRQAQTEQEKAWFQAHVDQTLTSSLMHRYGTMDEEVAPILFLASDEASYITGTRLPVAGGDPG